MRRFLNITLKVLLAIVLLVVLLYALLQLSSVQTWLAQRITKDLSERLNSEVSIKRVNVKFLNRLELEGLLVKDRQKDTLLYAGMASADVNDWFIFKDKISLNDIALDNARVNMYRKDSVWNYQYLIDYFSSPSGGKKASKGLELDLKKINFNNIRFNKIDQWVGQDMVASLSKLQVNVDSFNLPKSYVHIRQIILFDPVFSQYSYDGNRPPKPNLQKTLDQIPVVNAFKWNNSGFVLEVDDLVMTNGSYINNHFTERKPFANRFDGAHILFNNITGNFSNIIFKDDTLKLKVDFKAKERSGLEVKKLAANMKLTPDIMEFRNLDLQTNRSKLGNYYSMEYKEFNQDFGNYLSNVLMTANFVPGSYVSSDDIGFFAPELNSWKRTFQLQGQAKGTVENFNIQNAKIKSGNSAFVGSLVMRGLPDIDSTFIQLKTPGSYITYTDLKTFAPGVKNVTGVNLQALGNINFAGVYEGYLDNFTVNGLAKTDLGSAKLNVGISNPPKGTLQYKGYVQSDGFNLGKFTKQPDLGIVALDGYVDGKGVTRDELDAQFKGIVKRFDYKGYPYQNITLNGQFAKNIFKGKANINDPNIQIEDFDGTFDLSKENLAFNLKSNIKRLNLKDIGITKQNMMLSGLFNLNFTGKTIDDFLGSASILNAKLQAGDKSLYFDSLSLVSQLVGDKKVLTLRSNEFDVMLAGQFKVLQLPEAFRYFLSNYYPAYIKKPSGTLSKQNFTFSLVTKHVDELVELFVPQITNFGRSEINGRLNLASNELILDAKTSAFTFKGKTFEDVQIDAVGDIDKLNADFTLGNIIVSDSLQFPGTRLKLEAQDDISKIKLITSANKTLNSAEVNATIRTLTEGLDITMHPSTLVINQKKWELEDAGTINLRNNYVAADALRLRSGNQLLEVFTEMDTLHNENMLGVNLQNFVIEDVLPFFITTPRFKGLLNGSAMIRKPFGALDIHFGGYADSLQMNDKMIGKVALNADADINQGLITFDAKSNGEYVFQLDGSYKTKDSTATYPLAINLNSNKFNLNLLEPFLNTVFTKVNGLATANLKLQGSAKKTLLTGAVNIDTASMVVGYTNVKYQVKNQTINFGEGFIDIGRMGLKDSLGNAGTATGRIYHNFFDDFRFENVRLETEKLILLNTTKKDNSNFYGYAIGRARMDMRGPLTDLRMDISGEPSILDTSHIVLPTGNTRETSAIDYIEFLQFGREMESDAKSSNNTNITVSLSLTTNPAAQIDVILDEETGDIIKGRGNGNLMIKVGTTEPLTMRGRYELTQGEYTFNFQTFLKKPFTLNNGSITWNGDPYKAVLDIDAEYLAKNVNLASLTAGTTSSDGYYQKEDITILSHISGFLDKPIISFAFRLPEKSELKSDYIITKRLDDFQKDEASMNKQVASLLLFNSFVVENQNFLTENTLAIASSSIGGMISNILTSMFNKELEKATKGVISSYVDFNPTIDLQNRAQQLQANVRAGLKILLSSRLNLLLGTNVDINNPYTLDKSSLITPDITIEWILNKEGSLRVVGFNRSSIDLTIGQRNRSGVQLSYRKNFNRIGDIFKGRKTIEAEENKRRQSPAKKGKSMRRRSTNADNN